MSVVSFSRRHAPREAASCELTRELNRDLVLERIRALQPISRVDLARSSGLQPGTVSAIVEILLEEGWVRESAMVKTGRGRRPTLLSLNDDMLFLVADVRPARMVAAVVDLSGRFLDRRMIPISRNAASSVDSLADVLQQFREQHPRKTIQGVGVSLPGRVHVETGRLVFAPNLAWQDFPIRERLQERLGFEVQVENAANASLLSELWFGQQAGIRNAVAVTVSEGIGAAVLANGRLVTGQHGMAGEFGHISVDPEGPVCSCGGIGCWEVFASSNAALRNYRELEPHAPLHSILEIHSLAMDGHPSARNVLDRQARAIGQGLHLLNAIVSPEVILLVGDVSIFYDAFRETIEAECHAGAMDGVGPRIVAIGDGEFSRLRGAAAVVLERHSGYYRAAHARVD